MYIKQDVIFIIYMYPIQFGEPLDRNTVSFG